MAKKSIKDLRKLSLDELRSKSRELEQEFFQLKMKKVTGQLENTALLWAMRKQLAQVKTLETQNAHKGVSK